MTRPLNPPSIAPPFGAYSHGVAGPAGRLVLTSGQLGLDADGTVPASVREQAMICFGNIDAILHEAGLGRSDVVRLNAYVTDRTHMAQYMAARDAWLDGVAVLPASTLMIVSGFTRPEFLVEVEATAIAPDGRA
jgi:enamine deaminase RidA (YjgF/YER057c/UK114 family)